MIRVSYKKNFLQGPDKGKFTLEVQDISSWSQSVNFRRALMEVTEMFPAQDPVTGFYCFISDIKAEEVAQDTFV